MDPADEEIHTVMISLVPQGLVGIDILRNCQNPHKKGLVMMVKIRLWSLLVQILCMTLSVWPWANYFS